MCSEKKNKFLKIGDRVVGPGYPCLIIAEVAQAHDGSLGNAHAYIDAAARAGADGVKFQTHIASAESTKAEPWRVRFSSQDKTRYDYWKRMEFTEEQWRGLAEHAREIGLIFLSSPFSFEAADLLERIGVPAWKVGSGEVNNLLLMDRLARTGKPVLLSSGMSKWAELDEAVFLVRKFGAPVGIFQCTTSYPCPPSKVGLNVIQEIRNRYECPVGLSDHSATIFAGLAAATLGCNMVEVHIVFSRECFGPDTAASITTLELAELVRGIRFIEEAVKNPVDKDAEAEGMAKLKKVFGKSVVAARDLSSGHRLEHADLTLKKPGYGIPPTRLRELVGRTLKRSIRQDELIAEDDLE